MDSTARLLIYSHDSFGLGHLRRCRAIAHSLVERFRNLSVIILSGSPIIGSFDFRARVDFVRVPGVIKLRHGGYEPLQLHIDLEQTLDLRAAIIRQTARSFRPHLFLVDKEPLGLRGEVESTLGDLRRVGCRIVLGLRDVMDEPVALHEEWQRKGVAPALRQFYDEIWVYGLPQVFDPLAELPEIGAVADKVTFTGYLRRHVSDAPLGVAPEALPREPYILVTPGGGGDGDELIDWVLRAYETEPDLPHPALIVFGPFMSHELRSGFEARVARLPRVHAITFEARFEQLMAGAVGVVGMGGYNIFCEILSFAKPTLLAPRTHPRQEQSLRAERAAALGLVRVLPDTGARDPAAMARELRRIASWPIPDADRVPGLLDGLERIADLAEPWLGDARPTQLRAAARALWP
jgi:predicted glycosyltransferase